MVVVLGGWIKQLASNSQSFDQKMIHLKHCVEINSDLNLILNYKACKLSEHFFVLAIFLAKSCCETRSYGCAVSVVEGFGCGHAIMSLPIARMFGGPNDDDPEAGVCHLTRQRWHIRIRCVLCSEDCLGSTQ